MSVLKDKLALLKSSVDAAVSRVSADVEALGSKVTDLEGQVAAPEELAELDALKNLIDAIDPVKPVTLPPAPPAPPEPSPAH